MSPRKATLRGHSRQRPLHGSKQPGHSRQRERRDGRRAAGARQPISGFAPHSAWSQASAIRPPPSRRSCGSHWAEQGGARQACANAVRHTESGRADSAESCSVRAFLMQRGCTGVLSRVTDVVASQLLHDSRAFEQRRQRPRGRQSSTFYSIFHLRAAEAQRRRGNFGWHFLRVFASLRLGRCEKGCSRLAAASASSAESHWHPSTASIC